MTEKTKIIKKIKTVKKGKSNGIILIPKEYILRYWFI